MIKNISNLGDAAVYCDFGSEVNEKINSSVIDYFYQLSNLVKDNKIKGITNLTPSYNKLIVSFDLSIINFSQLKDLIYRIIHLIFGSDIELRFRPSYFPFTEPSAEVDILSKEGEWLEILGCGIVNPIVLENCNIDSKIYSGLAFGLGVERIAMLKHGVRDIREFYKANLDFLNQFK